MKDLKKQTRSTLLQLSEIHWHTKPKSRLYYQTATLNYN